MNNIRATLDKSDYEIYKDYLNFTIDGYFLDEKLDEIYPGKEYKGLVPTLNFGMDNPKESKIVWERIIPNVNERSVCPILMCPDDADILRLDNAVIWERLGIDKTTDYNPEKVGSVVDWFDKIKPLSFDIDIYGKLISDFKESFEKDKSKWLIENNLNE